MESSDDEKEENKEEGEDPEAKKKKKKKKNKKKKKAADEPTTANEPEKGVDLEKMKQEDVHPPTQTNEIFRCLGAWTVPSKHKFPNNQFQGYGPN